MTQTKLDLARLKQYLKNRTQAELVADIAELAKKYPSVRDYYQVKLDPHDEAKMLAKFKQAIENEFFPTRGFGKARLSVAKKAIADYKKLCNSEVGNIDLMLFYVEQGVKFTLAYGDINEAFYLSMEGMYEKALKAIEKLSLKDDFQQRSQKIAACLE